MPPSTTVGDIVNSSSSSTAMPNSSPASESGTSELKHEMHTNHNHQRLNSFSDDDSVDSDSEYHMSRQTSLDDEEESSSDDEEEQQAPQFETLVNDEEDPARAMSFSVNEEMVEVVPTDMVESLVSF
jgi:hypothetical protein